MKKIYRVKNRFVEQGLEAALEKCTAERSHTRKADGDFEAHLVALSCSAPPAGHARWSLLLTDGLAALGGTIEPTLRREEPATAGSSLTSCAYLATYKVVRNAG